MKMKAIEKSAIFRFYIQFLQQEHFTTEFFKTRKCNFIDNLVDLRCSVLPYINVFQTGIHSNLCYHGRIMSQCVP